jgi:hypothetical protein
MTALVTGPMLGFYEQQREKCHSIAALHGTEEITQLTGIYM